MATHRECAAMRLAIALSAQGLGTSSPNPPVGCVILDVEGAIVGTGYHRRKGESHAEANALLAAGVRAQGGTAVVTLEPCNHVGRTPACRQALIDAGVSRVVVAVLDPTSRGEGGVTALRTAGIDVEVGVLTDEAGLVLGPWRVGIDRARPYVIAGYGIGSHGPRAAPSLIDELRMGVDAVVYADGRIEEGVTGSHGVGELNLPETVPTDEPQELLRTLYNGGARTVLLAGPATFADDFLNRRLVDRMTLEWDFAPDPSGVVDALLSTPGYRLQRVHKVGNLVRVEYESADDH